MRRPDAVLQSGLVDRVRALRSHELLRAGAQTYAFSALTLVANLLSGVVTARALAPDGRGEAIAISMLALNVGLIFAFGCAHAVSYRYARDPDTGPRLLTNWAVLLVLLAAAGIAVGQLVLPLLFDAQSAGTVALARVYLVTVVLVVATELTNGLLLGAGEYLTVNVVRFAQPALFAVTQLALWAAGELTVATSLACAAGSSLLVQAYAVRRVLRITGGFGPVDLPLARETFGYGFRGQGVVLAGALNQRLDLLIMPAFLGSVSIGLYSVATNVSLIVYFLANSFSALVLPAAVREGEQGPRTVVRSLQLATGVAVAFAAGLALLAEPALEFVYGEEFGDAASALRLLLPGTVMFAAASMLNAGLYAANRPGLATSTQIAGLVVTVAGLVLFLRPGGIVAAAIVSTVAYATVFAIALVLYKRSVGIAWREFATAPAARPA